MSRSDLWDAAFRVLDGGDRTRDGMPDRMLKSPS